MSKKIKISLIFNILEIVDYCLYLEVFSNFRKVDRWDEN